MTLSFGLNPCLVSVLNCFSYALNMVLLSKPVIGSARMQLDS